MIPLWAKDKTGKWRVFPIPLHTFEDGIVGIKPEDWHIMYSKVTRIWSHLFTYDAVGGRMILKKQPTNE